MALPDRHVVLRFNFQALASRTKFRMAWRILGRSGVDVAEGTRVCRRSYTSRQVRDYVEVHPGHTKRRDAAGTALQFDGDCVQGVPCGCDLKR
jgi:hypothetical protein